MPFVKAGRPCRDCKSVVCYCHDEKQTEERPMSDDLVKRYTTYNVMMSAESGKYISSPDGKWVLFTDHADRIKKLEAKLSELEKVLARGGPWLMDDNMTGWL